MESRTRLRPSRSEHILSQDDRILALLDEMRPQRKVVNFQMSNSFGQPPPYHNLFASTQKITPPSYGEFFRLPNARLSSQGSSSTSTLSSKCHSPSTFPPPIAASTPRESRSAKRIEYDEEPHLCRNSPRQASFLAAVNRHPLTESNGVVTISINKTPTATPPISTVPRRSKRVRSSGESRILSERRRTTIIGDQLSAPPRPTSPPRFSLCDVNHNEDKIMRRPRPKSYVLATSASLPETDPASFSHDDTSRDMSSMGSLSSIEPSARSIPQAQSSHTLHKFISIFQKSDGRSRLRPKRSRTSLPEARVPLPESRIKKQELIRQGWIKYQENALGKGGRRAHWSSKWAVLAQQTLYLCHQPTSSASERDGVITLPAPLQSVDVTSSVVDIAYDWLAHQRHVLRLVSQSRTEHLLELLTEAEMLTWISCLQSASDGRTPSSLANSCSAASLASSCSSDRNASVPSATNQLIMHRYKAKSSQMQSPGAAKKSSSCTTATITDHCSQPGTSKENHQENGSDQTTPKSARKWKKSKAGKQGSGSSGGSQPPSILGIRLADCITSDPEEHIPLVIQICVSVVEEHGLDTVGIYRIPGNTAAVNTLKDTLSANIDSMSLESLDLSDARWRDVNVVSSFLKMFLRKLPEPLLTDKLYPFFIDANRIPLHQQRLYKLRNLLRKLPRPHYCTLRYLIRHLYEVTKHSDVNKMETRNVALMFGPSIVRPSDDNMATMVTHMSDQCKIIETLIYYNGWMFDDNSPSDDPVPDQHPSDTGGSAIDAPQYGVGMPSAVSASTFNDMHMLIRKANEEQAAAMMNEGKAGKIKNMLRRNSRRDKSKTKPKIESQAACAQASRFNSTPQQSSVDSSTYLGYQERDIDAEIMSRQTTSPLASTADHSPSLESSIGSIPDTGRDLPQVASAPSVPTEEERKRRQQDMYSARRIFIAGSEAAMATSSVDALANHTQHLNMASSPALEVLSEETRAKIRKMQQKQSWIEKPTKEEVKSIVERFKNSSPSGDQDALSYTSDYSTTSSVPNTGPLAVACAEPPTSSDYASSDPSPCTAQMSPRPRPAVLPLSETRCQQKIRMRSKTTSRDPSRRHTLSDVDTLKEGHLDKLVRWFGIRRSSPNVTQDDSMIISPPAVRRPSPPTIIRTSPNELTPASGDEQL